MSFLDDITGSSDDEAQNYLQQALAQYQNVTTPTIASGTVSNLPQESVQGEVTPEQIQAVNQAPNEYNNVAIDPSTRQAQIDALQAYGQIANSGGLDANAKLGIQQVINAANEQSQGAQGAIMQSAQAQGQGGGDFALTQRALAAQGASNSAATQGLQQAAEAEANREAALGQMATIGGNVNASDYNQASTKAAAGNQINATNAAAANNAAVGNVANNLSSQNTNVANAQGVNAANTTAGQTNAYYNASLPQQQFNDALAKANGENNVVSQQATAAQQAAANNASAAGKLIGSAGQVAAAYYGAPAAKTGTATTSSSGGLSGTDAVSSGAGSVASGANADSSLYGLAHGGAVPCYAAGGMAHDHGICMRMGGHVPGQAAVPGDSLQNDNVPAMLSPGELVIPRSVPKTGPAMEAFAKQAPVPGTQKKVDLTSFMNGYKKGK